MKRFWLVVAGILFLLIDVTVSTGVKYPPYEVIYEDMYASGKMTQAMVMYDVVGTEMKMDVMPDIIGYALLLVAGLGFGQRRKMRINPKFFLVLLIAAGLWILRPIAPFFMEERTLYGLEYFLGWLCPVFEYCTLFFIIRQLMEELECKQNHRDNTLIWTGLLATIFAGFFADMLGFFQLKRTMRVYVVVEIILTVLYCYKLYRCSKLMEEKQRLEEVKSAYHR